jgi:pimeloyl-ACP methyl ester carboxylesterase
MCDSEAKMSTGNYAIVNEHTIYYEQFGVGRPVVLLHGGLHTIHLSFEKQIPIFAQQHQVIAIEQIGHGHSADIQGPFSYAQMAEDTADLLRQLNITNADFVGWSDGGILALILARRRPTLVRRLVISGANIRAEGLTVETLKYFRETQSDQIAKDLSGLREAYEQTSPDGPDHWPVVVAKTVDMIITPVILEQSDLAAIQARVLVVAGDRDAITLDHTLEIFESLPQAQLCILPGTGHDTFQKASDWFNPIMLAFLDAS